jgi:shikimate kinase
LREILAGPCPVIACGGGIVLREENRQLLATTGTTVLLQAPFETLYARLQEDPQSAEQRPPLTDLESEAEIREILQQREKLYIQCADLIVETENKTPEQVAKEIREHLPSEI